MFATTKPLAILQQCSLFVMFSNDKLKASYTLNHKHASNLVHLVN